MASMIHLNQEQWLEKMACAVQPQLHHAVDHVSMVAHGIRKQTPLCERTSREAISSDSNRLRSSKGERTSG